MSDSVRPIDRVVQARRQARRSIVVPEWDGLALYFSPVTTLDVQAVHDRMREDGRDAEQNQLEKRVILLIQKAELEDGSRAFEFGDRIALMENAEWSVLMRVIGFMYESALSGADRDEAKKKSVTGETSSRSDSPSESS